MSAEFRCAIEIDGIETPIEGRKIRLPNGGSARLAYNGDERAWGVYVEEVRRAVIDGDDMYALTRRLPGTVHAVLPDAPTRVPVMTEQGRAYFVVYQAGQEA
jgi:hypothetical protein